MVLSLIDFNRRKNKRSKCLWMIIYKIITSLIEAGSKHKTSKEKEKNHKNKNKKRDPIIIRKKVSEMICK